MDIGDEIELYEYTQNHCPNCESKFITEVWDFPKQVEDRCEISVRCETCGLIWEETYILQKVQIVDTFIPDEQYEEEIKSK